MMFDDDFYQAFAQYANITFIDEAHYLQIVHSIDEVMIHFTSMFRPTELPVYEVNGENPVYAGETEDEGGETEDEGGETEEEDVYEAIAKRVCPRRFAKRATKLKGHYNECADEPGGDMYGQPKLKKCKFF